MKKMVLSCFTAFAQTRSPALYLSQRIRFLRPSLGLGSARSLGTSSVTSDAVQLMEDILYRVRDVNQMPEGFQPMEFQVGGVVLGKVHPENAKLLCSILNDNRMPVFKTEKESLTLTEVAGSTFDTRTSAVAEIMEKLRDQGVVTGWRDEQYPVTTSFYDEPVFAMERSAVPLLGTIEYGVHINGLVRDESDGSVKMWMARRAADKSKYPGMLDHIVAGGQPVGLSLMENVIKECMEEASIPEDVTKAGIRPAGAVSYETYSRRTDTITRAVLFNYDLYLPPDFIPKPMDGEVEEFFLWSVDEILESMAKDYPDPIKPNCYAVIIDYLLREGHLSPEIPGYLDVLRELRNGDCC